MDSPVRVPRWLPAGPLEKLLYSHRTFNVYNCKYSKPCHHLQASVFNMYVYKRDVDVTFSVSVSAVRLPSAADQHCLRVVVEVISSYGLTSSVFKIYE